MAQGVSNHSKGIERNELFWQRLEKYFASHINFILNRFIDQLENQSNMEINEARLSSLPVILKLSGKEVVLDELAAGQLQHELQARPHQVAKILHI